MPVRIALIVILSIAILGLGYYLDTRHQRTCAPSSSRSNARPQTSRPIGPSSTRCAARSVRCYGNYRARPRSRT
jgi:hypothetical protein